MSSSEQQPDDESYKAWLYVGYYATRFFYKVGELGERACHAIARGSFRSDDYQPNVAPLQLTARDAAHLRLLYEHIESPQELNAVILDVQRNERDQA